MRRCEAAAARTLGTRGRRSVSPRHLGPDGASHSNCNTNGGLRRMCRGYSNSNAGHVGRGTAQT